MPTEHALVFSVVTNGTKIKHGYRFYFSKFCNDWVNFCISYTSVAKGVFEGILVVLIVDLE